MRTHVEFRSTKFPAYPGEEAEVNPDQWGKRLVEYLKLKLREHDFATGQIYAEDWGWGNPLCHEVFPMWIGCGSYAEFQDGYLVFIEPSKATVRSGWFRKIDTTADVEKVASVLDAILKADPDILAIRWWSEDER